MRGTGQEEGQGKSDAILIMNLKRELDGTLKDLAAKETEV